MSTLQLPKWQEIMYTRIWYEQTDGRTHKLAIMLAVCMQEVRDCTSNSIFYCAISLEYHSWENIAVSRYFIFSTPIPILLWALQFLNYADFLLTVFVLRYTCTLHTFRHEGPKYFWHQDSVLCLVVLQYGTYRSRRRTHRSIQHMAIIRLK